MDDIQSELPAKVLENSSSKTGSSVEQPATEIQKDSHSKDLRLKPKRHINRSTISTANKKQFLLKKDMDNLPRLKVSSE